MPEDEQRELTDDVKRYAEMIKRSRRAPRTRAEYVPCACHAVGGRVQLAARLQIAPRPAPAREAGAPHTRSPPPRRWRNRVNRGSCRDGGTPKGSAPQGGTQENVIHLPRGGVYVRTKHGSIQSADPQTNPWPWP